MPEYTAAVAPKHIGEKATVVGRVDCISAGRTFHALELDGCSPNSPFWIIVNDDASGPDLNVQDLKGVTIAATGQIEKRDVYSHPWMVVKSTTQIQTRTPLNTDHISRAHEKESRGDLDAAIAEFSQAIELQPDRRNEAYEFRGRAKERKADWNGALADYDSLVALDPNNANSYYIRATQKKQHGDFEGAMADFTRAAELRSDPAGFTSIGDMRKERGDITGAAAEYDKAIALCDRQIAGTAKSDPRSPLGSDPHFSRGYARELKGDVDGALADYSQAIANNPAKNAMAYGARGNIRKTRGDLTGAISDYQHKYRITNYPDDEKKLNQLRAELKKGGKTAQLGANRNEQSSGTPASAPNGKSLAQQFVEAYSGNDADALAALYAERVDHMNDGVISNAAIKKQAQQYFARWPERQWSLVGSVSYIPIGSSREKIVFSANYDASDPQTKKHASGAAKETLIVAADRNGDLKIVSQKEQISKKDSSQPPEETSKTPILKAAKAEYQASSHDETARMRYVTQLADMRDQVMRIYSETGDKRSASDQVAPIDEELRKHPMPRSVDPRKLKQSLIGEWDSPRHTYVFRADGTYGVSDEQRDKWRIQGNEYIDDFSRGPIILLDRNHFIYAFGQGVMVYTRANEQNSSQADEETSEGPDLKAAKAEASKKQPVANPSETNAPAQAQTGSPDCTSDPKSVWSEASPDKRMLATIRFVPNPDKNWRAIDELKVTVFRRGRDGKPGQILASTTIGGRFLQCAHWTPDSQFLLFTTSPSRGGHGGWHFETFVYCAGDHSFRGDLEDVFGNVLAPDFRFDSPDIAVLTVSDDQAPSTAGEEPPTKQVRVSLGKVVDKLDRLP